MPKKGAKGTSTPVANDGATGKEAAISHGTKKKSVSKASKAGLLFPVPKINKRMGKSGWTDRVGGTAPIWVAAVCEYIGREIVQQAGQTCTAGGKHKRITPHDVILAIRNDVDLNRIFAGHKALVGDKIKGVTEDIQLQADKKYKDKLKEMAAEAAEETVEA